MNCIRYILVCFCSFAVMGLMAQAPQQSGSPYGHFKGIARNDAGMVCANCIVTIRVTIFDSTGTSPIWTHPGLIMHDSIVYQEMHTGIRTNKKGYFHAEIGRGIPISGYTFSGINWAIKAKWLVVSVDPRGGSNFTAGGPLIYIPEGNTLRHLPSARGFSHRFTHSHR